LLQKIGQAVYSQAGAGARTGGYQAGGAYQPGEEYQHGPGAADDGEDDTVEGEFREV
jgi:hypothetical protein